MERPWHEDDAFWTELGETLFTDRRWQQTAGEVAGILNLVEVDEGDSILDMPCGVGRHAIEFARRGFNVTGVDRTPSYLDEARRRSSAESLEVEWICDDMREFVREEAFDLVLNLFTSFGYFEDSAEDQRVAQNFLASLKPGGSLIMDLRGKEMIARDFRRRDWSAEADGSLFLEEREITRNWSWIRNHWIRIRDGRREEWRLEHRLYSATELTILLAVVGFTQIACFGGFDGRPYDHEAQRLIVTAQRPA